MPGLHADVKTSCPVPRGSPLPRASGRGDWQPSGRGISNALRVNPVCVAPVSALAPRKGVASVASGLGES